MAIGLALNGVDLCRRGPLWLSADLRKPVEPTEIGASVRIGISREAERPLRFSPLRFYLRGNVYLRP